MGAFEIIKLVIKLSVIRNYKISIYRKDFNVESVEQLMSKIIVKAYVIVLLGYQSDYRFLSCVFSLKLFYIGMALYLIQWIGRIVYRSYEMLLVV